MPATTLARALATGGFMALIAVLSLTPDGTQLGDSGFVWLVHTTPTLLQKTLHVGIYGALAVVWSSTLRDAVPGQGQLAAAVAITVVYGALLEWLQVYVPGRFGSAYDVGLNAMGAVAAIVCVRLGPRWLRDW